MGFVEKDGEVIEEGESEAEDDIEGEEKEKNNLSKPVIT